MAHNYFGERVTCRVVQLDFTVETNVFVREFPTQVTYTVHLKLHFNTIKSNRWMDCLHWPVMSPRDDHVVTSYLRQFC